MFHGSIPDDVRRILHQLVADWRCQDVYVGCSGNFTVERVLAETGRFRIHGNDVTLYSSVLGWYLSGARIPISLKPEVEDDFPWLADCMG